MPPIPNPRESATESGIPLLGIDWQGHSRVTSIALLSLLSRAVAGQTEFSRAERLLCAACEFWAAVNTRELDAYLGSEIGDPLRDARFAFSAIGAKYVVNILHQAAIEAARVQLGWTPQVSTAGAMAAITSGSRSKPR